MEITVTMPDTHAGSVLDDPSKIDALEIHGVAEEQDPDGGTICEIDDENPAFFSVYAHLRRGGVDCIADFPTREAAKSFARSIASEHGWRVW